MPEHDDTSESLQLDPQESRLSILLIGILFTALLFPSHLTAIDGILFSDPHDQALLWVTPPALEVEWERESCEATEDAGTSWALYYPRGEQEHIQTLLLRFIDQKTVNPVEVDHSEHQRLGDKRALVESTTEQNYQINLVIPCSEGAFVVVYEHKGRPNDSLRSQWKKALADASLYEAEPPIHKDDEPKF